MIFSLIAKLLRDQKPRCTRGERHLVEEMLPPSSRALSVEGYLALVQNLPLPTCEQRRNFVDYVTCAHSWYKHLPAFLPGAPFYFYIDRSAGCDWVCQRDGSCTVSERQKQGFRYSDIPTAEYRNRFGYLSYSSASGTAVFAGGEAVTLPRDKVVAIPGEDGRRSYLPEPVLNTGRVELTAVIHPHFAAFPWAAMDTALDDTRRSGTSWPSESGGRPTLEGIFKRLAEMRAPEYETERSERVRKDLNDWRAGATSEEFIGERDPFRDPVLRELLEPERRRQKTAMLKAIDRVCLLIHETGSAPGGSR